MDGQSLTPDKVKQEQLKELLPEAFSEGKIDWEKLKATLGEDITFSNERYVLNWAGKSEAFKVLQAPSTCTLIPAKDESVNFDDTENIFIEGENLEVLKVLQKSYFGKIKMIYIDPPYNTGNDSFIYPDKFSETKEEYLKRVGDKDEEGYMTKDGLFRKNSKENGQYHSNWLNMMYPRLFLAKNLLKDDGVIFVSIDDNEVHNLRLLMNEIFGEENFRGQIIRSTGTPTGQGNKGLVNEFDYLVCYSKTESFLFNGLDFNSEDEKIYDQSDDNGKYLNRPLRKTGGEDRKEDRPSMYYPILAPDNSEVYPIGPTGYLSRWRCGKNTYEELLKNGRIEWKLNGKGWTPYQKFYLEGRTKQPSNLWDDIEGNKKATREISDIFNGKVFDFPKPVDLIRRCLNISDMNEDIILDFFSGSATSAHAVMDLNKQDGGNRKYICVQLPELCDDKSEAFKAGYKTIADIAKERIRRAGEKIRTDRANTLPTHWDGGFRVLKVDSSNMKDVYYRPDEIQQSDLLNMVSHIKEDRNGEDLLFQVMLDCGLSLDLPIKQCTIQDKTLFLVAGNELAACFDALDPNTIATIAALKPRKFVSCEHAIHLDQDKTNIQEWFKQLSPETDVRFI